MYNIITTFNLKVEEQRWSEILFCISRNLDNSMVDKIYIALEANLSNENWKDRVNQLTNLSNKIFIHYISKRPTFEYLFAFCNNTSCSKWIISNADIYFPKSNSHKLALLAKRDYNKECFVLTRYNVLNETGPERRYGGIDIAHDGLKLRTMHGNNHNEGSSIDSWIFETPFNFSKANLDIQLGQPECDGMMNYQLSKVRKVTNPCLSIISIHKHSGWYPWYDNIEHNGRKFNRVTYREFMRSKGDFKSICIKFTKLE